MNTSNNALKIVCELSWLLLTCPNHTLGEAPPSDTANPPLRPEPPSQKNLTFPPCGWRVSPLQAASFHLQSGDGECLPATQLCLSVFTCPTQRVLIYRWMPARASRLDNLTFQNLLLDEAYPSDTAILNHSRTSARASGTKQPYLF